MPAFGEWNLRGLLADDPHRRHRDADQQRQKCSDIEKPSARHVALGFMEALNPKSQPLRLRAPREFFFRFRYDQRRSQEKVSRGGAETRRRVGWKLTTASRSSAFSRRDQLPAFR